MAEQKNMHPDFARWYAAVNMGDDSETKQGRWNGLLKMLDDVDNATLEGLLRLAFKFRNIPASNLEKIQQAFKDADDTFDLKDNDRELQVLAGATLAVAMENPDYGLAELAAIGATTASLAGTRSPGLPMDLSALGNKAIRKLSNVNRRRPSIPASDIKKPKIDFAGAVAALENQQHWPTAVSEAFTEAAKQAQLGVNSLVQQQMKTVRAMNKFYSIQDEELQMLWWLTGQYSEDLECSFDKVTTEIRPFVFAKELAQATEHLPGPQSVKALLSRAGLNSRKISVKNSVNALPTEWLNSWFDEEGLSPLSTPLHFAIARRRETGPGDAWTPGWAATIGVDEAIVLPGLQLGELFYRERLLLEFK